MNDAVSPKNKPDNLSVIVGIGASAGGLEALQKMLPGLPSNSGISYVFVQHLAPRYHSMLDSLLTRHTCLSIKIIEDGTRVEPDTLYITPPSKDVKLSGDRLQLSQVSSVGPKPCIDFFFTSLAQARGTHAVGIVLSGTGTDGAHGIRAIKSNDGITIAQKPDTAKFDGMPNAAIDTDSVDLILPPEKIGPELASALKYPDLIAKEPTGNEELDEIKLILNQLNKKIGADFSEYKFKTMYRRISRRMVLHKLPCLHDYLNYVKKNPDELERLYRDLLISVTGFFRDPEAFEALAVALRKKETLANRMPHLVQRHHSANLARYGTSSHKPEKTELWKEREFASSLLNLLDCSAVMTDGQGNIQYVRGDVSDYLKLTEGTVKDPLNAVTMAQPEFRSILQSLLHRAGKENRTVVDQEIPIKEKDGNEKRVRLRVGPVKDTSDQPYFLILFQQHQVLKKKQDKEDDSRDTRQNRIKELEQELEVTGELLQDTLEELETSGEELQSLNEELQSANEELQASNEELETSNEELQASNEELNTVNQELRVKTDELSHTLDDLEGSEKRYRLLVDYMNEALLVCELEYGPDKQPADVIIQQANRAAEDLLDIDANDLPFRAGIARLSELTKKTTLEKLAKISRGRRASKIELRFSRLKKDLVLSTYYLDYGKMGIVCRDVTRHKQAEKKLRESQKQARQNLAELEAIYNSAPVGLCLLDTDLRFVRINETLAEINGIPADAHIGKRVRDVIPDLDGQARAIFEKILATGKPVQDIEVTGKTPKDPDTERTWMEQWMPVRDKEGSIIGINVVTQDITSRKIMEKQLRQHKDELENLVKNRTRELTATVAALELEMETHRATEESLKKRTEQLARLTHELTLAEQRERRRLAGLLHDHVQQLLVGAKMRMETLCRRMPEADLPEIRSAIQMTQDAIGRSRSLSAELFPPVLYSLGLVSALEWLAGQMEELHGLKVDLHVEGSLKIGTDSLNILLFQSIRELLFNVVKHSGESRARLELTAVKDMVRIKVSDQGIGFDPENMAKDTDNLLKGFGLFNIKERLQFLGGSFTVDNTTRKGACVILTSPVKIDADTSGIMTFSSLVATPLVPVP